MGRQNSNESTRQSDQLERYHAVRCPSICIFVIVRKITKEMAHRLLANRFVAQRASGLAVRSFGASPSDSAAPTVFDKLISLTIVDPSGARRKIPAMVGTSLYEACEINEVELGPMSEGGIGEI